MAGESAGFTPEIPVSWIFQLHTINVEHRKGVPSMSALDVKNRTVREIWLLYFNKTLLEKGIITEKEHNRMKLRIQAKPAGKPWI